VKAYLTRFLIIVLPQPGFTQPKPEYRAQVDLRWRIRYCGDVPGILYVVATPIGNLEDMTYRGVRILKEVDLIACEDTRHTRRLLDHYGIEKPAISYHEHNEAVRTADLISRLETGVNIALVSDAGTPLISDPGYRIVSAATAAGIPVLAIPGPSAILTALTASGLPTDSFFYGGFLPAKQGQRRKALASAAGLGCTAVFYEAPHRIFESLGDIAGLMPARAIVVAREMTKLHEEYLRGTAAEILQQLGERPSVKGEITIVIGKAAGNEADDRSTRELLEHFLGTGLSRMDAIKEIARSRGVSKREVYAELEEQRS
jgi:16S rRNA (cytidine1402-2'-O)-methyltransferase